MGRERNGENAGEHVFGYAPSLLRKCWAAFPVAFLLLVLIAVSIPAFALPRGERNLGGFALLAVFAALPYLAWRSLSRSVRAVGVSEKALTLYFWLRGPLSIPWPETMSQP